VTSVIVCESCSIFMEQNFRFLWLFLDLFSSGPVRSGFSCAVHKAEQRPSVWIEFLSPVAGVR
jgi:hypothetical protein